MPRPSTPGLLACVLAALAIGPHAAVAADAIEQARAAIRKRDAQAAIRLLEPELIRPGADRSRVVPLLIQGYDLAIAQATAAGKAADAEFYRENLKILSRKNRSKPTSTAPAAPAPAPEPVAPLPPPEPVTHEAPKPVTHEAPKPVTPEPQSIAPLPETLRPEPPRPVLPGETAEPPARAPVPPPAAPGSLNLPPAPESDAPTPAATAPAPRPIAAPISDSTQMPGSLGPKQGPAEPQPDLLAQADSLYLAKRYDDARAIYAKLAAAGQLPQERRDHWAYCRSVAVAKKIQAKPKADAEWAAIDQEIEAIRRLNPKMWYAEYLRNRAAERGRGLASKAPSRGKAALRDPMVVRSAGPEEPAPAEPEPTKPVPRPQPAPRPQPVARQPEPAPAMVAEPTAPAAPVDPRAIPWQFKETGSFRIHHTDAALAESIANIAEKTRSEQTKRWTGSAPAMAWWPKCEIIVYPDGKTFAAATQQPEDSPGFSTIGMDQGKITARLVHIRADHAGTLEAVLPHEVTHIILADLFPNQQIPRWADEGMAVMSEPNDEQDKRATDLNEPLKAGRLFPLRTLMAMDYPDNRFWNLYYAQSVSLTRFLVEQGSPAQLVQFLHLSQKSGVEEGLRQVYKISGFEDLEKRWNAYAKSNLTTRVAVAPK